MLPSCAPLGFPRVANAVSVYLVEVIVIHSGVYAKLIRCDTGKALPVLSSIHLRDPPG